MTGPDDAPPSAETSSAGDPVETAASARPLWQRLLRLEFLDHAVDAAFRWLIAAVLIGIGPGLALWPPLHRDEPKFVLDDVSKHLIKVDLELADRIAMIEWALASALLMGLVYAALGWRHKKRGDGRPLPDYFAALNLKLLPVALLPVLSALVTEQFEARLHLLSLFIAAASAALLGYWYYHQASAKVVAWREGLRKAERRRVPELLMVLLVVAYTLTFGYLSVNDHWNLGTHIYDLALYDNTFWNTVNGDLMACSYLRGGTHYSAHYDPIIILLSPIYALYPRAETLLWLQSGWLAMGGIPLYLMAKRRLQNPWQALTVMGLFYLAPALHGINMFDFHSLALMVPLVMWMVYLLDVGTPTALVGYFVALGLLLLTREDMPFVACAISLYAIAIRRRWTGIATILVALTYLFEIKSEQRALLSGSENSYSYSYYYEEMIPVGDEGLVGLATTALSDPLAALAVLLKPAKLIYFGKVMIPLLLLPLWSGKKRLLLLYGFAFIGLVSRKYVFSVHFQYSSVLLPFLLMAWPDGLVNVTSSRIVERLRIDPTRLRSTLMFSAFVATMIVSAKFGAVVPNREFHAGWNRLQRSHNEERAERYQHLWDFIEQIPAEASVCSNSIIGPHVSNRPKALKWPSCREADYVLMANRKLKKKDRRRLDRLKARHDYEIIDESEQFILLRKLPEDERDEARKRRAAERRAKRKTKGKAKTKGKDTKGRRPPARGPAEDDAFDDVEDSNPYRTDKDDAKPKIVAPKDREDREAEYGGRGRNDEDEG